MAVRTSTKEHVGRRFGRLVITGLAYSGSDMRTHVTCECDCGVSAIIRMEHLLRGAVVDCGCGRRGRARARQLSRVTCACGCGTLCSPGKRWIVGHSLKVHRLKAAHTGHKHSAATKLAWARLRRCNPEKGFPSGAAHPNFKHGLSSMKSLVTSTTRYDLWREAVYARDGYTCTNCGTHCRAKDIAAHHIKALVVLIQEAIAARPDLSLLDACLAYPPLWDVANGVTYCRKCHINEHRRLGTLK